MQVQVGIYVDARDQFQWERRSRSMGVSSLGVADGCMLGGGVQDLFNRATKFDTELIRALHCKRTFFKRQLELDAQR